MQKGEMKAMTMMIGEKKSSQSQVHMSMWQGFGVLRIKHQRGSWNRQPIAYAVRGGGAWFSPNT